MDKPIVLFLIDSLQVGGAERSLLMLCRQLRDYTPVILVISDKLDILPDFQTSGIKIHVNDLPRNYRFKRNAKLLKPLIDSINPQIIHSSLFHADMTLRYLDTSAKKVTGLVSTMYSTGRLKSNPWLIRQKIRILKQWDKETSPKIDLFIANSESIKDLYIKQVAYNPAKIKVIYRGRKLSNFYPRNNNNLGDFLFVGRLIQSKGVAEAILAFDELLKDHPNLKFKIAGDGPEKENLTNLASSLRLDKSIEFLGQVNSVHELLSQADYFVFPTHYEGLPGSLIEAMMARVPIICSDIPENKECVDESMCLFHRVGDQADLLAQMEKALIMSDWADRTQRAFDFASTHFEISKIARQYEEVYRKLLNL